MSPPPAKQQRKLINSILHHAKNGDWEGLRQLLDDETSAGLEYRHGNPLHEAIIGGHPETVQHLIDRGFSVDEKGPNAYSVMCRRRSHPAGCYRRGGVSQYRRTAFVTAAYWDAAEVLQLLIDQLLPSNQISLREWEQAVAAAAANRHAKSLEILLRYYPGAISQQILDQALAQAAAYCHWDEHEMMLRAETVLWEAQIQVIRLLLARGANPNSNWMLSGSRWTRPILHSAILGAQGLETIQMLLDYGADIQVVDHLGMSVLAQAVINGDPQIVRFFLEKTGNAVSVNQRLPLERWYNNRTIYCPLGGSLLHIAAYKGTLETVKLLLANGADPLAEDDSNALPFHSACKAGRIEVAEFLWSLSDNYHLESRATKQGWTPLFLAVVPASYDESAVSVLTFLIEKGADVNAQDCLGRTPLSFYIQEQGAYAHERVIDLLRKHGAATEVIRDSEGKTVKDWAVEKGCLYDWDKQVSDP